MEPGDKMRPFNEMDENDQQDIPIFNQRCFYSPSYSKGEVAYSI